MLPAPVLLRGLSNMLAKLYAPDLYFDRALRSLEAWRPTPTQRPPELPMSYNLRVLFASMWKQGVRSSYRRAYWRYLSSLIWRWSTEPAKMWLGFMVLLSAHHFVIYAREVAEGLERDCQAMELEALRVESHRNVTAEFPA